MSEMRALRKPVGMVHLYGFYLLAFMVVVQVAGAFFAELRDGGSLISAMFTGRKLLADKPVDAPPNVDEGSRSARGS